MLISNSILRDLKSPNEMILCSALRCVLYLQVSEVVSSLIAVSPLLLSRSNCRQPLVLCC